MSLVGTHNLQINDWNLTLAFFLYFDVKDVFLFPQREKDLPNSSFVCLVALIDTTFFLRLFKS